MPDPRSRLRRGAPAVALAALTALALAACAGRGGSSDAGDVSNPSAAAVPAVVTPADCQDYQASPGITPDSIKLGGSYPDSGPLANIGDVARGMKAYFASLNEQGGVNGRRIEFVGLDDQYDPTRTVNNVNELLQREQVFAIAGVQSSVGTTSVWDDLERRCVPMLMSTMAGSAVADRMAHLNVTDALVPYAEEGFAAGKYAAETWRSQNVAFLGQSGIFGEAFLRGLRTAVDGTSTTIGATQTYQVTDPTVTAQVTNLRASGADTLVVAASGTKCAQILDAVHATGWTPHTVISWTCSSATTMDLAQPQAKDGVVTASVLRVVTPGDPESDRYLAAVARYGDGVNPRSEGAVLGWAQGQLIAEILGDAPALTRTDVINSALSQRDVSVPMLQDGVTVTTSATDNTPFEMVQMRSYDAATSTWRPAGDVVDLAGVLQAAE